MCITSSILDVYVFQDAKLLNAWIFSEYRYKTTTPLTSELALCMGTVPWLTVGYMLHPKLHLSWHAQCAGFTTDVLRRQKADASSPT